MSIFEQGLAPAAVNHIALTPLSFIERTASVYPHYPAVIHGNIRRDWAQTYQRCRRLASALAGRGIGQGDTVAVMLPNIPEMLEAHYGVPMIGAVLNTLNVRLDAEAIAFMLQHGEAKVLITDYEFHEVIHAAIGMLDHQRRVRARLRLSTVSQAARMSSTAGMYSGSRRYSGGGISAAATRWIGARRSNR
ncbi:AMP-binding protein, partial [Pseudomonas aeruginosa]|nr:AMP-binding protein [Pseudomonas aeruginosa]